MLIEKEKEFEKIFRIIHDIGIGKENITKLPSVDEIMAIIKEWCRLVGNNQLIEIFKPLLSSNFNNSLKQIRIFDILISPFEHYMISLEEFKINSCRDATTRCGIVIERMCKQLWYELKNGILLPKKVEDQLGGIQSELTKKFKMIEAEDFCHLMKAVYHMRDRKGPHDVPAAEFIDAKFCISSILHIYPFYLKAMKNIGFKLTEYEDNILEFVNSIVLLSPKIVSGKKGKSINADELLTNLYQNGFFKEKRTLEDIEKQINERKCSIPKTTLSNALNRFYSQKKILNRYGKRRGFRFIQRVPPEEFFK